MYGPEVVVWVAWTFDDCIFPQSGVYYVQLYFGSQLGSEGRIRLIEEEGLGNGQSP